MADKKFKLTETQIRLLEKSNPEFRERHVESHYPGYLLCHDTFFVGRPMIHLYEISLEFNDIKHRKTKVGNPKTNGFVERFNKTVLDEFFRTAFCKKLPDKWLHQYNYERPHRGYRNSGRRPIEIFDMGLKVREQMKQEAA